MALLVGCVGGAGRPGQGPSARAGTGKTSDEPALRCGPEDSYRYVAGDFRCPDGTNPLGGDPAAGGRARRGSSRDAKTGHFVDVYEVPCSPAPARVYVDMYGCPEYEAKLARPAGPELEQVNADWKNRRYAAVIERCSALIVGKALEAGGALCLTLLPAALFVTGKRSAATVQLGEICGAFPRPSPDSDVRAKLVVGALGAIVEGLEREKRALNDTQAAELVAAFIHVCGVPAEQIEKLLEPPPGTRASLP